MTGLMQREGGVYWRVPCAPCAPCAPRVPGTPVVGTGSPGRPTRPAGPAGPVLFRIGPRSSFATVVPSNQSRDPEIWKPRDPGSCLRPSLAVWPVVQSGITASSGFVARTCVWRPAAGTRPDAGRWVVQVGGAGGGAGR
ncbi:MAG: hypothetical protein ACM3VX_05630 [Bacteroidota bacterium]